MQWVAGDDGPAKATVIGLIDQCGWLGIDLGGIDDCAVMEAPRRPGAVYGEEYRGAAAAAVVAAVRSHVAIPATPHYRDKRDPDRDTTGLLSSGRLEAFSDGVLAIAITLLILDVRVPPRGGGPPVLGSRATNGRATPPTP